MSYARPDRTPVVRTDVVRTIISIPSVVIPVGFAGSVAKWIKLPPTIYGFGIHGQRPSGLVTYYTVAGGYEVLYANRVSMFNGVVTHPSWLFALHAPVAYTVPAFLIWAMGETLATELPWNDNIEQVDCFGSSLYHTT